MLRNNASLTAIAVMILSGTILGQRPSLDKSEFDAARKSGISTVSYCDLIQNPNQYDQKIIRVKGTYQIVGGEYSNLFDLSCSQNLTNDEKVLAETETW